MKTIDYKKPIHCAGDVRNTGSCDVCGNAELRRLAQLWMLAMVVCAVLMVFVSQAEAADWRTASSPTSITIAANAKPAYFTISAQDVSTSVAEQIKAQSGVEKSVAVTMNPGTPPVLSSADHPLRLSIQALQVDTKTRRWQAQAYILGKQGTQSVQPIAGRFETVVSVPMLTRQLSASDVIEAPDLTTREIPERQLRKDTATDAAQLIGKSPIRMVSADRPIRLSEIAMPNVIKKGQMVEMSYTTEHILIKDQGIALEDGATGKAIRVKNSKTGRAVTAFVTGEGRVETNTGAL